MAGPSTDYLTALLAEVEADPTRWGAFALLRGVDAATPNGPRIGEALDPAREVLDLTHQPSQDFPRTTIAAFVPGTRRPAARSQHLGLTGPMGPLPTHLTEIAIFERRKRGPTPFADFLDLISARALQRFFRAWAEADRCAQADRPADDRFAGYIGAVSGAADLSFIDPGSRPKPDRTGDTFDGWRRLPYAGHLAGLRSASAVGDLLAHLLERPVKVIETVGRWRQIPVDARTTIGRAHAGLGRGATLGGRFYAVEFDVAFEIGVASMAGLADLLPGGHANRLLGEAARTALPKHLDWRARVTIAEDAIEPARLGRTRLGWTSWVAPRGTARIRRDLALRDNAARAA
jgi:type VI secretion system protein ImpH